MNPKPLSTWQRHRPAVIEAGAVALIAIILSFVYTAVTDKGVFRSPSDPGVNATVEPASVPGAGGKFVMFDEALALQQSRGALFIDARHAYDYAQGHIPGAMSMPLADARTAFSTLKDIAPATPLVTYCDGEECNSSIDLAMKLDSAGFTNVRVFFGGWNEWLGHGQAVER